MSMLSEEARRAIRTENADALAKRGYRTCGWLPLIGEGGLRGASEIADRAAVMSILLYAAHKCTTPAEAAEWIDRNNLYDALSPCETAALESLDEDDLIPFTWYAESLCALSWLCNGSSDPDPDVPVDADIMDGFPDPRSDADASCIGFTELRSEAEAYRMLDLLYNAHWFLVDERVAGRANADREGVVYERRKALEWAFDAELEWDDVPMDA
ncbi:MAG: DUF4272 domain-containing protein [Candidatus Methanoplasma sp.]|jgi:hypothetical protein|nr:DUF4272 domain-containing protein [Candidatus Methanoplasma sp.]